MVKENDRVEDPIEDGMEYAFVEYDCGDVHMIPLRLWRATDIDLRRYGSKQASQTALELAILIQTYFLGHHRREKFGLDMKIDQKSSSSSSSSSSTPCPWTWLPVTRHGILRLVTTVVHGDLSG